jgi:lysyl-tRNA synthetase class 2
VTDVPDERALLNGRMPALRCRYRMLSAAREFLAREGFLEVETPVRIPTPALEDYIEAEPAGDAFLRTSPELHMKRLLAAGYDRIFQIGPCFRQGERGRWHLPEFTMLEWYRLEADHRDILRDTIGLVRHVLTRACGGNLCRSVRGCTVDFGVDWEELTVEEAFRRYANRDVDEAVARGEFERVLVERVEPHLGVARPTVLTEYPLACSGLSRPLPDRPDRVERWELVDYDEQAARFAACARLRASEDRPVYALDEPFMSALRRGLPPAAGIAIGFDRFVAVAMGADSLAEVTTFADLP